MSEPSTNPIRQQMQLLLGAYGFNFYDSVTNARADDLLVRQAASGRLTAAVAALTRLDSEFRRQFVPPSTREQPYPPSDVMQAVRDISALKGRIGNLEARIRGSAAPSQDKVWWRVRNELSTLEALLSYDNQLIAEAEKVQKGAEAITAESWNSGSARCSLDVPMAEIEATLQSRVSLLQVG